MFFNREVQVKLSKPSKSTKDDATPTPLVDAETAANLGDSALRAIKGVAISIGALMVLNAACTIAVNAAPKN